MDSERRNQLTDQILKVVPLALGLLVGAMLVRSLGSLPLKWNVFIVGGIVGLCGLALFGTLTSHLRGAMMFLAVAALPTFYEIVLGFRPGGKFSVLANGFPVTLFDVFFFPLCAAWIFQRWLDPRPDRLRLPKNWALFLGLMLAINVANALFVAREPFFSFGIVFAQVKGCVIVFMMANMIKTEHSFRVLGYAVAAILIIEGMVVMEQRFVGVIFTAENLGRHVSLTSKVGSGTLVRLAGTLDHPNDLAMYLNLCLPITFFMYLTERKGLRRLFLVFAMALALISEIWSGSRGGWLGLGVAVGSSLFFWMRKRGQNPLVGLGAMALTVTLLFGVLFAASTTFRARLVEGDAGSAEIRYPLMEVAMEMIRANPVQGVGLNMYTREMVPYDRTNYFIAYRYNHPVHNTFLMVGAETGLFSMLVLASFIFFIILEAHKVFARNSGVVEAIGIGVFGTLISWFIHNQVNLTGPYSDQTLWVMFGLLAAACLYRQQNEPHLTLTMGAAPARV